MHRRLWLNDPDCLMLRTEGTGLSPAAARTWAHTVGLSGGMALVSDDLALLGADARALLDETVALGRATDADARAGGGPRCPTCSSTPHPGGSRPWPVTWPPTRSPGPPSWSSPTPADPGAPQAGAGTWGREGERGW